MDQNFWKWDGWNALAAIGQCVGAIFTFFAVLVALKQVKPHVKVIAKRENIFALDPQTYKVIEPVGDIIVTATNNGVIPVTVTNIGYRMPDACYTTTESETRKLPIKLEPGDEISLKFSYKSYAQTRVNGYYIFYARDTRGTVYLADANIFRIIYRFLWWAFAKYLLKYRESRTISQ